MQHGIMSVIKAFVILFYSCISDLAAYHHRFVGVIWAPGAQHPDHYRRTLFNFDISLGVTPRPLHAAIVPPDLNP